MRGLAAEYEIHLTVSDRHLIEQLLGNRLLACCNRAVILAFNINIRSRRADPVTCIGLNRIIAVRQVDLKLIACAKISDKISTQIIRSAAAVPVDHARAVR
ncbi:hypothetical protein D3C78_1575930 [compost metagenome]